MSGQPYIDGDTLEEARLAIKAGHPIGDIAPQLGLEVAELQQRLGLPQWKTAPMVQSDADQSFDLWAVDRLDGVL